MRANSAVWALLRLKSASPGQPGGPGAVLSRAGGWLQPKYRFYAPQTNAGTFWICSFWGQRMTQPAEMSRPAAVARLSVPFSPCPGPGNTARVGASNIQLGQTISTGCTCAAMCLVPTPPARGHKVSGQRASRSPAPALGLPVKVIGDAPAQKASLGGTVPAKEEPWQPSQHRSRQVGGMATGDLGSCSKHSRYLTPCRAP